MAALGWFIGSFVGVAAAVCAFMTGYTCGEGCEARRRRTQIAALTAWSQMVIGIMRERMNLELRAHGCRELPDDQPAPPPFDLFEPRRRSLFGWLTRKEKE